VLYDCSGAQIEGPIGPLRRTPLMWAADADKAVCVEALLEFGIVHWLSPADMTIVQLTPSNVVDAGPSGANPDVADAEGSSPLIVACRRGSQSVARLLLVHGANVNYWSERGECALSVALSNRGSPSTLITMLVQFGADPNIQASQAQSAVPAPAMRFASEEHKLAAEQGVVYRKTISRVLMDMLSEWTLELPPPNVIQTIRDYLPGSELPARFFVME